MTPSLRIICDAACKKIQVRGQRRPAADVEGATKHETDMGTLNRTQQVVLMQFAGCGWAELSKDVNGDLVWAPTPRLFIALEEECGALGLGERPILDDDVQGMVDTVVKLIGGPLVGLVRTKRDKRAMDWCSIGTALWHLDSTGEATAYLDADGKLAWKASEQRRRFLAEPLKAV